MSEIVLRAQLPSMLFVGYVVFALGIGALATGAEIRERPSKADDNERLDRVFACGPTSLYALLKLYGKEVRYEHVYRNFDRDDMSRRYGCSLADLKEVADKNSLPCEVLKLTSSELRSLNRPVIGFQPALDHDVDGRSGHFIVVTAVLDDRIHVLDGYTGEAMNWTSEYWDRTWNGYTLVPTDGRSGNIGRTVMYASVVFWIVLLATMRFSSAEKSP